MRHWWHDDGLSAFISLDCGTQNTVFCFLFCFCLALLLKHVSTYIKLVLVRYGFCGQQPVEGGIVARLKDHREAFERITQPWNSDTFPTQNLPYDMHTWDLPIEMSMSMLLFITITGLARCKVPVRLVALTGIMWYSKAGTGLLLNF